MKAFIYIFYFIFLILGGFRNYSDEIAIHEYASGFEISQSVKFMIQLFENSALVCCFFILVFPLKKNLHLFFFLLLFSIDIYYQNIVRFEDYIILVQFIPLAIYFYLKYAQNKDQAKAFQLNHILILVFSIGYFTNFVAKFLSGWYDPNTSVIYNYIALYNIGYKIDYHFSSLFLSINNHVLYKSLDYVVLLFQFSAIFLFFRLSFFKWFSLLATIFHIGVLFIMEIPVFYGYILFYALVLIEKGDIYKTKELSENISSSTTNLYDLMKKWFFKKSQVDKVLFVFLVFYLILFCFFGFDKYFILRNMKDNWYIYHNSFFTLLSAVFFMIVWSKKYYGQKRACKKMH